LSNRPTIFPELDKPVVFAASMATQIISPPTNINMQPGISYDLAWTGSPTGTFAVQVSNTYRQSAGGTVINAGNWNTLPTSSFTGTYPVPAGSAGNGFLDVVGTEAAWVRIVYNPSGGTGNLTVVPASKVW
jgi:hypothetical protein